MLNIPVPEPQLQRPRVVAVVRQLEPAGVPEHVGMHVLATRCSQSASLGRAAFRPHRRKQAIDYLAFTGPQLSPKRATVDLRQCKALI